MSEIYVIANGKGGSGKTTTAYYLAQWLTAQGRPPLIWGLDGDVQGITKLVRPTHFRPGGADVLAGRASLTQAAALCDVDGALAIPESPELREVADSLTLRPAGVFAVGAALNKTQAHLGARPIVIDTPGSINTLTRSAILAAVAHGGRLILPTQPDPADIAGISETIQAAGDLVNTLRAGGVPLTDPQVAGILVVRRRAGYGQHDRALAQARDLAGAWRCGFGVVPTAEGTDRGAKLTAAYTHIYDQWFGGSL